MSQLKTFVFCCVLAISVTHVYSYEFWNDLRVTWWPYPKEGFFNQLPRNSDDAKLQGWFQYSSDCNNNGKFAGYRFITPQDYGVVLLYDTRGFVAGIQAMIPFKDLFVEGLNFNFDEVEMFQPETFNGDDYYVLTAYFVHPESICNEETDLTNAPPDGNIGVQSQVYFQIGPNITALREAPKTRNQAEANGWTRNECRVGMGNHNFWEVENYEDHDCTEVQPHCLLFNERDELAGFCFTVPSLMDSPRFEHSSVEGLNLTLGDAPQCILDQTSTIGTSTMHIYFINDPWNLGPDCP